MTRGFWAATAGAALLFLSACGNNQGEVLPLLRERATALIPGKEAPAPVDPRKVITRAMLDQSTSPVLLAEVESTGSAATLLGAGQNGPWISWRAGDGSGLSTRGGLLGATRGLGPDLLSADLDEPLARLAGQGSGPAVRVHRYLDGEDRVVTRSFLCQYAAAGAETIVIFERSHPTRRLRETCHGTGLRFVNDYWVGPQGTIWKSRQWVGPDLGYVGIEQLVR
jgi:hypothetical protein